ncbi:hypothetical protein [Diaminobutyricibacter sp. McL0608]|uniref:hypothetical protein n=1 Tax=Leifsonia sp. McL0608 TaxID=3143537 RepID=UPI0031F2FD5E
MQTHPAEVAQVIVEAIATFIAEQLMRVDGDPRSVVVPGLDGENYPSPASDPVWG